jgi:signal transduction histidine kinase/CheY-like chemotaxis protein
MSAALNEGHAESILAALEEAVVAWDRSGRLVYANPAARALGLGSEPGPELLDGAGRPLPAAELRGLCGELTLKLTAAGRERWVVARSQALAQQGLTLCVLRDVTARRQQELRQQYLAQATESLACATDCRQALAAVVRLAVPQVADWCALDLLEGEELYRLAHAQLPPGRVRVGRVPSAAWRVLRHGEPELLDGARGDRDQRSQLSQLGLGSYLGVPLRCAGQVAGVLSFGRFGPGGYAETELSFARLVAERASAALEQARRLSEQASERQALLRANRSKDEFLAILGHELRNPLSPILSALQLVRMRGVKGIEREREILERQVRHMVRLVDDLLDLTRISRGQLDLKTSQRVELADVVQQAVEVSASLLEERGHELQLEVPRGAWVHGEQARLAQVVGNLLTNAARHSEPGGQVRVACELASGDWWLRVSDRGRGIAPELLERVFEPFVQDPGGQRAAGGLGLGLAIARRIVELHGGSLEAHSAGLGQGSTFTVRLPAARPPEQVPAASPRQIQPARGVQLLVVDDYLDGLETLAAALELAGHQVRQASDGPSALASAQAHPPEIALLDIALPGMDGYELARQLSAQHPALRLVALTGYGQDHDRDRSRAAGFCEHLLKPVEIDQLLELIERLTSPGAASD